MNDKTQKNKTKQNHFLVTSSHFLVTRPAALTFFVFTMLLEYKTLGRWKWVQRENLYDRGGWHTQIQPSEDWRVAKVQDDVLQREYFKFFWLIGSCHVIGGPAEGVLSSDVTKSGGILDLPYWEGSILCSLLRQRLVVNIYIFIYIFCFKY